MTAADTRLETIATAMPAAVSPRLQARPGGRGKRARDKVRMVLVEHTFAVVIGLIAVYLVIVPVVEMLWASFRSGDVTLPGQSHGFTLEHYVKVYTDPQNYKVLLNTAIYAGGATLLTMTLATFMAWLVERTNMPGKKIIFALILVPIAIPHMLLAIAWILLMSPNIGFVNMLLRGGLGWFGVHPDHGPLNIYTMPGMIFMEGIVAVPTAFLIMTAAFRNMDASAEEASLTSRSGLRRTFFRVTLPLARPAILSATIYSLVTAIASFEVPGIIGLPAGIEVLSTRIYYTAQEQVPPDVGSTNAFAVGLLGLSVGLLFLYRRATRNADAVATVTGKGYKSRIIELGRWRHLPILAFAIYFILVIVLPLGILIWGSLLPFFQTPSMAALKNVSFDNYTSLLHISGATQIIVNTLILMVATATVTMLLSFTLSWVSLRSTSRFARILDSIAFLPHTIPSIVVGLAFLILYLGPLRNIVPIYGTLVILILAYTTKFLAYGTRTASAALLQIHKELEEAAYVSGSSPFGTFRKVVFPLTLPAFINGWLWTAVHSVREVSIALMLLSTGNMLIGPQLWYMWGDGQIGPSAALGVVMLVFFGLTSIAGQRLGSRLTK